MTPEDDTRQRLVREAEAIETRLIRDVDAIASSWPVEAVRTVRANSAAIRVFALGVLGFAMFALAMYAIRTLRRERHAD